MPLFLLDRDGVVVVNRKDNIKTPAGLALIAGAAEAIARLNGAGFDVAICTNQPEVARGAMSHDELDRVHDALTEMLAAKGGRVASILCCICNENPTHEAGAGMLREALAGSAQRGRHPVRRRPSRGSQGGVPCRLPAGAGAHRSRAQGARRRAAGFCPAGRRYDDLQRQSMPTW